jgi:hypothetical protein
MGKKIFPTGQNGFSKLVLETTVSHYGAGRSEIGGALSLF